MLILMVRLDAVSSATVHSSGTVLATCSGQRHRIDPIALNSSLESSSCDEAGSVASIQRSAHEESTAMKVDNSLKVWALENRLY